MQLSNNYSSSILENQLSTPTDQLYAIGEPSPVLPETYSDDECSIPTTPVTNISSATSTSSPPSTSRTRSSKKTKTSKRKQVKNACINCQKACKKCDEGRACQRCVKLGIADSCVDSPRKERLKGVKRGPYKKRQRQNVTDELSRINIESTQPFLYEQAGIWDIKPVIKYESVESPDNMLGHEQLGYYPYQQQQQQQPYNDTTSPHLNSFDQYTSPFASSLSTSPASSTMLLPQDTLHTIFTSDDVSSMTMASQEPIYPIVATPNAAATVGMMTVASQDHCSLSPASSLTWSTCTPSPTTATFIPHLTQSIYHHHQSPPPQQQPQPQQLDVYNYYHQQQDYLPHQKLQLPLYWDSSSANTYDWSSSYSSQPYM